MTLASIRQEAEEKYPVVRPDEFKWTYTQGELRAFQRAGCVQGRLDQAEADARIADAFDWQSWSEPNQVIAAAIREAVADHE